MNSDGALDFNSDGVTPQTPEIVNNDISTIIFGTDGKSIYNNGFTNEATGIYHLELPLTNNGKEKMIVEGCNTYPWVMASDTNGNIYAACNYYDIYAYSSTGNQIWVQKNNNPDWVIIDDDETMVISGTSTKWTGFNIKNGDLIFNTT